MKWGKPLKHNRASRIILNRLSPFAIPINVLLLGLIYLVLLSLARHPNIAHVDLMPLVLLPECLHVNTTLIILSTTLQLPQDYLEWHECAIVLLKSYYHNAVLTFLLLHHNYHHVHLQKSSPMFDRSNTIANNKIFM